MCGMTRRLQLLSENEAFWKAPIFWTVSLILFRKLTEKLRMIEQKLRVWDSN